MIPRAQPPGGYGRLFSKQVQLRPFLDRCGAAGDLAGFPFDGLPGFAPGRGVGIPLVPVSKRPRVGKVEILSPEDTARGLEARIADYLNFGVPAVWVIDP
jgi:hypothetical protein